MSSSGVTRSTFFARSKNPANPTVLLIKNRPYFDAGTFDLALKHIVQETGSELEIGKDVADADLDQIGH